MSLPRQTLGVLGEGAAARRIGQAARELGWSVQGRSVRPSDSPGELAAFAAGCDALVVARAGLPLEPLRALGALRAVYPGVEDVALAGDRLRLRGWLKAQGFPQPRFVECPDGDLTWVIAQVGRPCVVKPASRNTGTPAQRTIRSDADLSAAAAAFQGHACVLERWVDFSCEIAITVARTSPGEMRAFPAVETLHARQHLDYVLAPARLGSAVAREAEQLALSLAERLQVVGLLTVDLFVAPNGEVLVNTFSRTIRPSGAWAIDGCETSQEEQLVRAVLGRPLGSVALREPVVAVMVRREEGGVAVQDLDWDALLRAPRVRLHLDPDEGFESSSCFTVRDATLDVALERARSLRLALQRREDFA